MAGHTVPSIPTEIRSRRQSVRGTTVDVGREDDENGKSAKTLLSTDGHMVPSIPTGIRSRRQSVRGTTVDVGREDDENGNSAKTLLSTDGHMVPSIPTGIRSRRQSVDAKTTNNTKQVDGVGREADENDSSATPQPSTDGRTVPNNPKGICSRRKSVRGKPCDDGSEGDKNDKSATTLLSTARHTVPSIPTGICSRRQSVRGKTCDVGREGDKNGKSATTLLSTAGHTVPSIPTGIRSRRQSVRGTTVDVGREDDENGNSAKTLLSTDGHMVPSIPTGIRSRRQSVRGTTVDVGREDDENGKSPTSQLFTAKKSHMVPSIPTKIHKRQQSVGKWNENNAEHLIGGREDIKHEYNKTTSQFCSVGHMVSSPTKLKTATNESESFVTPSAIRVQTVRRKTEDSKKRVVGGCENSSVTISQPSSSGHPVSSSIKMKPIRGKARTKTDQVQTSKTEFRTTSEYEFPSMHSKLEGSFWQPKGKPINIKGRSSIPQINDRTASSEEHGNESVVTPPKNAIPNMPTTLQSARAGAGADFLGLPLVEASSSVSCKLEADTGPGTVELEVSSKAKSTWSFIRELPLKDLDDFVRSWEQGFRLKSENTPAKGRMRYYNCSRIKVRAKPQCTRQLLAFIPNTTGDVSVSAKGQHSCHEAPAENLARSKLATGDKQLIDKLVGSGIPSMHIKLQLQANNGNFDKGSLNYAVKSSRENCSALERCLLVSWKLGCHLDVLYQMMLARLS
ncbi:uncharacterized protein LOC134203556 isoform X1 [Armigeres subalbatus]|uniref:uncharacterized protein LOC134203556 isoform X1 n=1 Tax=Armigeres subalbatus TaxID=124917 RepID=UPI002ED332FB